MVLACPAKSSENAVSDPSRELMNRINAEYLGDETRLVREAIERAALSDEARRAIVSRATRLVSRVRDESDPTLMEAFLSEYGLSTQEGIALMCLAEALLRVPDTDTIDDLIADKITGSNWDLHSGQASSVLVNASTWALMLTGRVLSDDEDEGILANLTGLIRRVGEPVIRAAVSRAMRELGEQFVLGQNIEDAVNVSQRWQERGYTFSYDMLGEGARTDADARRYHLAYADAITAIARGTGNDVRDNPGISVKLSALHPRYEATHEARYFDTLLARTRSLAVLAAGSDIGFNIDAEEADRLVPSLRIVEALLKEPALAGWEGLGVVVQAYGRRASHTLDWLYERADTHNRRIMVRLVKGAYWDTQIKRAQVMGLQSYPVFTRKAHTDVSYIACARQLMGMQDRIYAQFATHNAHTLAAVLHLAEVHNTERFELQRLHGMGEALHEITRASAGTRTRIYAPVGVHQDLLAYLVRRLLENGANSSFVHQIVDERVAPEAVAEDPFGRIAADADLHNPRLRVPRALIGDRDGATGWDLTHEAHREALQRSMAAEAPPGKPPESSRADVQTQLKLLQEGQTGWADTPAANRADLLLRAAERFETEHPSLLALLVREAGKTLDDAIAELREAVDFLRFYATQAAHLNGRPLGTVACISPWNFPLAIFTGQIAASLAAGNTVIAKPAEQTPAIAAAAIALLHEAGVPESALQLAVGAGSVVGAAITGDPRTDGVCFTGSLPTARRIHQAVAAHAAPYAPLIAETGGINAMIVDSTALPEQAVRDIIASAFQSAGQRCSALRMLYLQEDVAPRLLEMIQGAMDMLVVGHPASIDTDVGPVIDAEACSVIQAHVSASDVIHQSPLADDTPNLVPPTLIRVPGIEALEEEVFGPVLHVATFRADQLQRVVDRINASGYGLTFGLHTRLDDRVQQIVERLHVGNIYVNRNQIGAVVETQPFGGEGLSGTGPKAGGYHYLPRLQRETPGTEALPPRSRVGERRLNRLLRSLEPNLPGIFPPHGPFPELTVKTPGPTGERNMLTLHPRGRALCLGPSADAAMAQARCALASGCAAVVFHAREQTELAAQVARWRTEGYPIEALEGFPTNKALTNARGFDTVAYAGDAETTRRIRQALAARTGAIVRFSASPWSPMAYLAERHVCTDTTAAGGNTSLMTGTE